MSGISPGTYSLQSIGHQTGLSVTATSANTFYNIGSSVTIPRNGLVKITTAVHIGSGSGYLQLVLTRGAVTYYLGGLNEFIYSAPTFFNSLGNNTSSPLTFEFPVLGGDVLQLQAENGTAGDIVYVDDFLVMLQ